MEKHEFDVDILNNYHQLAKLIDSKGDSIGLNKEALEEIFEFQREVYFEDNALSTESPLPPYMVIPSTAEYYESSLVNMLIWFDINKIPLLLEYQKAKYRGKKHFVKLITHGIYENVKRRLLVENDERLKTIMSWATSRAMAEINQIETANSKKYENAEDIPYQDATYSDQPTDIQDKDSISPNHPADSKHQDITSPDQSQEIQNKDSSFPNHPVDSQDAKSPNHSIRVNVYCKSMPDEFAKEHFQVFTTRLSKNGKPFLTQEQFDFFIDRAFYGYTNVTKQTINCGTREKYFVLKRFYGFYLQAVEKGFEDTMQCKEKYIRLVSNNFSNWTYEEIKDNFGNKVKREW